MAKTRKDVKKLVLNFTGGHSHFVVYDTLVEISDVEGTMELSYTKDHIGHLLNMSRQSVSRSLSVLEKIGAITLGNKNSYIKLLVK